jgi:hypothetical protein
MSSRRHLQEPRRLTFILHYYKDDESIHPKERLVQAVRPPLLGFEFVSLRNGGIQEGFAEVRPW